MLSLSISNLTAIVCRTHKSHQAVEPRRESMCVCVCVCVCVQKDCKTSSKWGTGKERDKKRQREVPLYTWLQVFFFTFLKASFLLLCFSLFFGSHTHPNTSLSPGKSLQIQHVRVWFGVSASRSITFCDGCITSLFCHVITQESLWRQTALWVSFK